MEFDGPALVCCYTTCQPEHGVADSMATDQARVAVDTRPFPLLCYDPRKGDTIKQRLSLQGNPAVNDDWWVNPKTGEQVDFIDFARSEGHFAEHFDRDGSPSETLLMAKQDRLENWKVLQELAGVLGKKVAGTNVASTGAPAQRVDVPSPTTKPPSQPAGSSPASSKPTKNGGIQRIDFSPGMRLKYHDGAAWITGILRSTEPAILALEDQTEIHTTRQVLADSVRDGLIAVEA